MPKFNHAYDFAFEVISEKEDASDVTHEMLARAAKARIHALSQGCPKHGSMLDACQSFDTFEEDGEASAIEEPQQARDAVAKILSLTTTVSQEIASIRQQLEVNLEYFTGHDQTTLEILQGHIEDDLHHIERKLRLL